jgi:uncharacterized protein DUF3151
MTSWLNDGSPRPNRARCAQRQPTRYTVQQANRSPPAPLTHGSIGQHAGWPHSEPSGEPAMSESMIPLSDGGLPLTSGPIPILLPPDPPEAVAALDQALGAADPGLALRAVAAHWPAFIAVWARLGEWTFREGRDVEAFAFARTGYHRGLDRLRQNGWRGMGYVPWSHAANRGVLRAIRALMLASAALNEPEEAQRCRQLLLESDPADPFGVGSQESGAGSQSVASRADLGLLAPDQ